MDLDFDFRDVFAYREVLWRGLWLTVQLTFVSTILGFALGVICALAKDSRIALFRAAVTLYIEIIRNTPFLVQLFFLFFGLASLGLKLSEAQAAILAMTVNLSAYAAEIIRGGIQSIRRGQLEAGTSLGLSRGQIFRHIVFLPALQAIYPALASQFIIVMLGSSVVSQISAEELTFSASFIQSRNFRSFEVYLVATALYLALSIAFRQGLKAVALAAFPRR